MDNFYDSLYIHRMMLRDDVRNQAYRKALFENVKPGDVVLDFGAGTGILSMFAAQAGAARVFAVERTGIASLAKKMFEINGFSDRITIINENIETACLPQKVDVIVSEWLGTFGVDENLLEPLLIARDRWLRPDGLMLPETVAAIMAPIWSDEVEADMSFWRESKYDLDLTLLGDCAGDEMSWAKEPITGEAFMSEPQTMWTTTVYEYPVEEARLPFRASLKFKTSKAGKINALTAWFNADFGKGRTLTNSPAEPKTHWGQYVFPLKKTYEVEKDSTVIVEYSCIPAQPGYSFHAWSVKVNDDIWEHHDTRRIKWRES